MKINTKFILLVIVIVLGGILLTYFFIPPIMQQYVSSLIDAPICTLKMSKELGVENNYIAIKKHIIDSLSIGMSHDTVIKTLKAFAPIKIGPKTYFENHFGEQIVIDMCSNPLNNIALFVIFSKSNTLIEIQDDF